MTNIRSYTDVHDRHFRSLETVRKINDREARKSDCKVGTVIDAAREYELSQMRREQDRVQRDLELLQKRRQSFPEALRLQQQQMEQQQVASATQAAVSAAEQRTADFLKRLAQNTKNTETRSSRKLSSDSRDRKFSTGSRDMNRKFSTSSRHSDIKITQKSSSNKSAVDKEKMGPDGRLRTEFTIPPFEERYREARRARYIRSQDPEVLERERELTTREIFQRLPHSQSCASLHSSFQQKEPLSADVTLRSQTPPSINF